MFDGGGFAGSRTSDGDSDDSRRRDSGQHRENDAIIDRIQREQMKRGESPPPLMRTLNNWIKEN